MAKKISAEELDRIFDEGEEDVLEYFDLQHPMRPNAISKRVNVDFPVWMVEALDAEAKRIGIGRQAVIKTWIAERLDEEARRSA
ncbi:MAG: CopG family transcriptional regulator [Gordonibacter sp.]|uniref:type II toxin-antitoxin system BrnA family antitoxin n=1 Tax=Gordonibacter sp. TaxID=1968902 RepID=UPI002FC8A0E3